MKLKTTLSKVGICLLMLIAGCASVLAGTQTLVVDPATHNYTLTWNDGTNTYAGSGTLTPVAQPATTAPSPYESINWLAQLGGTDPHGYFNPNAFVAKTGTYGIFVVGDAPGSYPTGNAALAAGKAFGKDICIEFQCRNADGTRGNYPAQTSIIYNGHDQLHPIIVCCTPDFSSTIPPPIVGQINEGDGKATVGPSNIVVANLCGYDQTADPTSPSYKGPSNIESGVRIANGNYPGGHLLFSGLRASCLGSGLEIQSGSVPLKTVVILNCNSDFCCGMNFGVYTLNVQDLLIRGGCLYHNGWLDGKVAKTALRQSFYIQEQLGGDDPQVRIEGVIVGYSAAQGVEMRTGGILRNSILFGCSQAGFVAERDSLIQSVLVDGGGGRVDLTCPGGGTGWGLQTNVCPTCTISNCTLINGPKGVSPAYIIQTKSSGKAPDVASAISMNNCIAINWANATPLYFDTGGNASLTPRVTQTACDLTGVAKYPDSSRTLLTYIQSLKIPGITDEPSFFAAACEQNEMNWDVRLTEKAAYNWIANGGFAQPSQN